MLVKQYEPQRQKTYLLIYAHSEDSDQSVHSRRLIWIFTERSWIVKDARFLHTGNEDSDQTVRMRKLWIFAGRTCLKERFLALKLICSGLLK